MAPRGGRGQLAVTMSRVVTGSVIVAAYLRLAAGDSSAPLAPKAHANAASLTRFPAAPWLSGEEQLIRSFVRQRRQHWQHKHSPGGADDEPDSDTPFEWTIRNDAGAFAAAVCAMLANAAGLGGGPFFQVIFNLILGFDLRLCAGLSHTVVAIGALAAVLYGLLQPSPTTPRTPLLNFDLAMVLVPSMLFGISIGVVLCPLSPEWVQTALLSVLLMAVTHKTFSQGVVKWRQEQDDRMISPYNSPPVLQPLLAAENGTTLSPIPENEVSVMKKRLRVGSTGGTSAIVLSLGRIPYLKVAALALLWIVFVGLQLAKAQHHHCTWAYFGLVLGQGAVLAGFAAAFAYRQAVRAQLDPQTVDSEFLKMMAQPATAGGSSHQGRLSSGSSSRGSGSSSGSGSGSGVGTSLGVSSASEAVVYQPARMLNTMAVVAAAGVVAGMLGIAGAMLFNPFLLAMGVHPQVVAATAIVIVLFGSCAISLSFMFNGMLNMSYLTVYAPIVFIASLVGVTLVSWAIRRTGRQSVLLFLMSSILALGLVSVVLFGGQRAVADIRGGRRVGFNSLCDD